jgi:4'-phosphopantetheinyl transferase
MLSESMMNRTLSAWERIDWLETTAPPVLDEGQLHIWRIPLDRLRQQGGLCSFLSSEEISRAERLRVPEKREAFIAARAALRVVLARYLGLAPRQVELAYLSDGKPQLADPEMAAQLQFNLSHSGDWMVLALSAGVPVGVDVEQVRSVRANGWALAQLFCAAERETLAALPEEQRDAAFIAAWTMKEAVGKADGRGVRVRVDTTGLIQEWFSDTEAQPLRFGSFAGYQIVHFNPAPGFCASLALAAELPARLRFLNLAKNWIETV